jgi:NADPH:quinone reductase-like Zn-dependent oxidoreductase
MKAIVRDRYGTPAQVLEVEQVPTPVPAAGEVLVRVKWSSVNTADVDDLTGTPLAGRVGRGLTKPKSRAVGLDMAGVVETTGPGVDTLGVGDEVWADLFAHGRGALAEFVCAPVSAFVPKPREIGFEHAAAVPHSGVLALQGLKARGGIRSGEHLLINGAGGMVGPLAIQIAKSMGAEVTGVDHDGKLDLMLAAGADHVVDYAREDVTRNGRRYDRVLDIAATRSFLAFRRSLAPGGLYVLVARNLAGFFAAAVFGPVATLGSSRRMGVFTWEPNRIEDLTYLARLIESDELVPIIDGVYPLEEAPRAIARVASGEARGKVMIEV